MAKERRSGFRAAVTLLIAFSSFPSALIAQQIVQNSSSRQDVSPLRFQFNYGQTDETVKYLARAASYNVFLTGQGAIVMLHQEEGPAGPVARGKTIVVHSSAEVLRMRFADANPPTQIAPLEELPPANLAESGEDEVGSGSTRRSYTAVAYRGIYPGTDVVFRGDQRRLGLDLELTPGADPRGIVLMIDGATKITFDANGNAVLHAGTTTFVLERPTVFVQRDGIRQRFTGAYLLEPHNRLRFLIAVPSSTPRIITD